MIRLCTICFLLGGFLRLTAQENELKKHIGLIKELCRYDLVRSVIGSDQYIMFKVDSVNHPDINFAYGIANKITGKMIQAADSCHTNAIRDYGKYISFTRCCKPMDYKNGLLDSSGNVILNPVYDFVGKSFIPLPDSLLWVAQRDSFGVFNMNTGKFSGIKYSGWFNDGYLWHEGCGHEEARNMYRQLNIEGFKAPFSVSQSQPERESPVSIYKADSYKFYLVKDGQRISKQYKHIQDLHSNVYQLYLACVSKNPFEYAVLDTLGNEIIVTRTFNVLQADYYVGFDYNEYFFFETQKILYIPCSFKQYVTCYEHLGFLGFKHEDTGLKLFVDKHRNYLFEDDIP